MHAWLKLDHEHFPSTRLTFMVALAQSWKHHAPLTMHDNISARYLYNQINLTYTLTISDLPDYPFKHAPLNTIEPGPPRGGGGATGAFCPGPHSVYGPKRSIYSNRTVKYSIKAVTTYILPWAPQALSAALYRTNQIAI